MFCSLFQKLKKKERIHVFVRHCFYSAISGHKRRIEGYSKEKCHRNLLATTDPSFVDITYIYDSFHGSLDKHFLSKEKDADIVTIKEGKESSSFLRTLAYIESLHLSPNTIIYLLEDDYLHRQGWPYVLLEAFKELSADYVTLYDHKDKYFFPMYENLESKIYHTHTCHWRKVPSTTNTFAMRMKTLSADMDVHKKYSQDVEVSKDHEKFLALKEKGAVLLSPMPAWSTHTEVEFASPCVDWEELLEDKIPVQ